MKTTMWGQPTTETDQASSVQPISQETNINAFFKTCFRQIYSLLVHSIWDLDKPTVSYSVDRFGQSWWRVYDPTTKKTFHFDSENEARAWIEKHYIH